MKHTFLEQKFEEVKTIDDFKKVVMEILQEVFNEINENEHKTDENDSRLNSLYIYAQINESRIEDLECKH